MEKENACRVTGQFDQIRQVNGGWVIDPKMVICWSSGNWDQRCSNLTFRSQLQNVTYCPVVAVPFASREHEMHVAIGAKPSNQFVHPRNQRVKHDLSFFSFISEPVFVGPVLDVQDEERTNFSRVSLSCFLPISLKSHSRGYKLDSMKEAIHAKWMIRRRQRAL